MKRMKPVRQRPRCHKQDAHVIKGSEGGRRKAGKQEDGKTERGQEMQTLISRSMRGGMRKRSAIASAIDSVLTTLMMRTSLKSRSGFTTRIILRDDGEISMEPPWPSEHEARIAASMNETGNDVAMSNMNPFRR